MLMQTCIPNQHYYFMPAKWCHFRIFVLFQLKGDLTKSDNFKDGLALRTTYQVVIFFCIYIILNKRQVKPNKSQSIFTINKYHYYTCFTGIYQLQRRSRWHSWSHVYRWTNILHCLCTGIILNFVEKKLPAHYYIVV